MQQRSSSPRSPQCRCWVKTRNLDSTATTTPNPGVTMSGDRTSYGCINVPVAFDEQHVRTIFTRQHAVIHVLPDSISVQEVFGTHAAATPWAEGLWTLAADRTIGNHPVVQQRPQ